MKTFTATITVRCPNCGSDKATLSSVRQSGQEANPDTMERAKAVYSCANCGCLTPMQRAVQVIDIRA